MTELVGGDGDDVGVEQYGGEPVVAVEVFGGVGVYGDAVDVGEQSDV